jgi:hypothetical protein
MVHKRYIALEKCCAKPGNFTSPKGIAAKETYGD